MAHPAQPLSLAGVPIRGALVPPVAEAGEGRTVSGIVEVYLRIRAM